jgi:LmbE family N-acetylglucosaminyl deacetylase|tara:strand:+ start:443 stop:661 length:219 start_codon:yes stop_codon:yes gene_type:complete
MMEKVEFRRVFRVTADAEDKNNIDTKLVDRLEKLSALSTHKAQEWMRNACREKLQRELELANSATGERVNEG